MYFWNILNWLNRHLLKTYPLIEDCARCYDCGRNVHDFYVPDKFWLKVVGRHDGIYCYDCFCNRADEKIGMKWRMELVERWYVLPYYEEVDVAQFKRNWSEES